MVEKSFFARFPYKLQLKPHLFVFRCLISEFISTNPHPPKKLSNNKTTVKGCFKETLKQVKQHQLNSCSEIIQFTCQNHADESLASMKLSKSRALLIH